MQNINQFIIQLAMLSTMLILSFTFILITILLKHKQKHFYSESKLIELKYKFDKDLLSVQVEIQEETLSRISKEIHDNISLGLTLSKLHLNTLADKVEKDVKDIVDTSIDLISKSLVDLNDLSKSIDGETIKKTGLLSTIESELTYINKINLFNVEYVVQGTPIFLDWKKELMIFRIIQESIRNSIKHSKCSQYFLRLIYEEEHLTIKMQDNGAGFNMNEFNDSNNKSKSSGLYNIQSRSKSINGSVSIESSLGQGTIITLVTPYK